MYAIDAGFKENGRKTLFFSPLLDKLVVWAEILVTKLRSELQQVAANAGKSEGPAVWAGADM